MAEASKIEWCDSTFNPWSGCTKISPACDHCYAAALSHRLGSLGEWGAGAPRKRTSASNWNGPKRWNDWTFVECASCGHRCELRHFRVTDPTGFEHEMCPTCSGVGYRAARRRVFCASLADWLDNEVPIEWLADLLDLIRLTPNLDWLLLTKRIGNWRARLEAVHSILAWIELQNWIGAWLDGYPPANVWLGATICNQAEWDRDVPKLDKTPAQRRFLSMEPLLGAIDDHSGWIWGRGSSNGLDWVIAGGESGPKARPSHPDWFRSLRDQCAAAGVPFNFKQHGEWLPGSHVGDKLTNAELAKTPAHVFDGDGFCASFRVGKKAAGRLLDGREHNEFPAVANG